MGLSDVPTEILLCIADQLQNSWQVNALGQTCRGFYKILNPYLYLFNKRCSRTSVLYHGIRKDLHSSVERLLTNMVSSKALDEAIFMKGLEIAIQDGQLHMVELLIQAATDVPELSHWPTLLGMEQDTLFWQAASAPNEAIVQLLLQHGVVPHSEPARWGDVRIAFWMHPSVIMAIIDTTRWRAEPESLSLSDVFFYALRFPSSRTAEIIKCLIEKGVDPNLPSSDGETPLCMAIRNKMNDVARCLLENGASSEAPGSLTYPLNLALWEGETETAKVLLERLNPSDILAKGGCVDLLFCAAAACGAERILEELLQRGCHPDTTMEFPMTLDRPEYPAIFWAVRHKQEETFRLLLKHGATPYPIVLTEAAHCGNALIAEMLLHAGADPNWDQGPYFIMPYPLLLQALPDEHVFRVILNAGAVLPEEWPWDRLLGRALENRQIPQVEMLLNRGISFDKHGNELLARAAYGGTQMLELVARVADERHEALCGPSSTSPLEIAVCRSDFAAFKWLMDKRLCEVPDGDYLRYLILRILDKFEFHHAEQAYDMLVKCGADINAPIPSAPSRWRWIMPIVPGSPFAWKIVLQTDEAVVKAFLDRGLNPISGTGASPEDVPPRYGSSKSLDLVLQWVLSQYPHGQAKPVLSSMKTRAEQEEQWGDLRQIFRFEDSNGLA